MFPKKMIIYRLFSFLLIFVLLLGTAATNIQTAEAQTAPAATTVRSPTYNQKLPLSPHTFRWDGIAAASSYLVRIDDATTDFMQFQQLITATQALCEDPLRPGYSVAGNGNCSLSIDLSLLPGGKHEVRVQTYSSVAGPWSTSIPFETIVPPAATELLSPINGQSTNSSPAFTWKRVDFASRYLLSIVNKDGNAILNQSYTAAQCGCADPSVAVCSIAPTSTLTSGPYTWNVQTWNENVPGAWATVPANRSFIVTGPPGIPVLQQPVNGSEWVYNNIKFTWNSVAGATSYLLEVIGPPGYVINNWFSSADLTCTAPNSTCTYDATAVSFQGGQHTWKVKAKNASGEGEWSTTNQFNVQVDAVPLAATTLVSPLSTPPDVVYTTSMPTFTWKKLALASAYLLSIDGSSGNVFNKFYTTSEANCGTDSCSITLTTPLAGGQYTWDIQTWNNGKAGLWSGQPVGKRTFMVSANPAATTLISPPQNGFSNKTPSFDFYQVTDTLYYLLQVVGPNGLPVINNWYSAASCAAVPGYTNACRVTPGITLAGGVHTWKVMTWNTSGLGPWSEQFQFTVSSLPAAPTLVQPILGATTTNKPTFVWQKVALATSYRLTVNKASGENVYSLTYTTAQSNCATNCSVTPPTSLTSGNYTWTVEGLNGGAAGPPSVAGAFTVASTPAATNLVSPIAHATSDNTPTLTWEWIADASFYLLQIDGPNGIEVNLWLSPDNLVFDGSVAPPTLTIDLTIALSPGTHSWKVMTWNAFGSGPWSDTEYFVVPANPGAPVLIEPPATGAPSIQITNTTPSFTWYEVPGITNYQLMLEGPSGFTTFTQWVNCSAPGNTCVYPLAPALTISGNYSWKVQAANSIGGNGTWSAPKQFVLVLPPAPVLLSPLGTTTSGTPTFRWRVVPYATKYTLTITGGGVTTKEYTPAEANCDTSTCYVAPFSSSSPLAAGPYTWEVEATNAAGNGSAADAFTVGVGPGAATLTQPLDGATNVASPVTFRWSYVNDALWYFLEIKDSFGNIKKQSWKTPSEAGCTTVGSTCSVSISGLSKGNYNWSVRTYNAAGFTDSLVWTFKIPGLPEAATLVSPSGAISTTQPVYIWKPVDLADWYYIRVQNASSVTLFGRWMSAAEASCGTDTCFIAHTALTTTPLEAGDHTWHIQTWTSSTTSSSGYGGTSSAAFTVVTAPAKVKLISPINGATTTAMPTFTWERSSSATMYRLKVNGSSGTVINTWYDSNQVCSTNACSVKAASGLNTGNYTWTVTSSNSSGDGPISDTGAFSVSTLPDTVRLVSPIGGESAPAQPSFTWTKVSDASWYLVEVTGSATTHQYWYTAADANCGTQNCSVKPSTILAPGTYSWKVQTWNSGGYKWSASAQFVVPSQVNPAGATTLVSPINNAVTSQQPAFTWNKVENATRYLLSVDSSSGNIISTWYTTAQANCGSTTCSVTPAVTLPSGNMTWKVKVGYDATEGAWSSTGSFIVQVPLTAPVLISPIGAITTQKPTFRWNEVPSATEYLIRVDGPNGREIYAWYKASSICAGTTCSVTSTIDLPRGSHTWKVTPWAPRVLGPTSNTANFTIQ